MKNLDDVFPQLPNIEGSWTPIYLEPIIGSGERITIVSAAVLDDKTYKVEQTIRPEVLDSIYGYSASDLQEIIDWTIESLSNNLEAGNGLENWTAPLGGIVIGNQIQSSADSLDGLIQQSIRLTASLSKLAKEKTTAEQKKRDQYWTKTIEIHVKELRPELVGNFRQKIVLGSTDVSTRFGFLSERYAANFSSINTEHIGSAIPSAKSKILDLGTFNQSRVLVKPQRFDLILKSDDYMDLELTEETRQDLQRRIANLREVAEGQGAEVVNVQTPLQAAEIIAAAA